jgi:hypothetical protein
VKVGRETLLLKCGRGKKFSPVLKVPRQCPLVFLVDVSLREGKIVGSEKSKVSGSGLCYEQGREVEPGL